MSDTKVNIGTGGLGLGSLIAVIISYVNGNNILWVILHGLLSWLYVIFHLIVKGLAFVV